MARWAPDALRTFQALVATGCVELLSETSHHSLAALVDPAEFRAQVVLHRRRLRHFFGAAAPTTFRNTELIVRDDVVRQVADLGYRVLLAEGCPRLLGDRDPHRVHRLAAAPGLRLLARDARRSDDLAFRFRRPRGGTLRPDVYARLLRRTAPDAANAVVNLFMDFETFGEHLKADSGVLDFLDAWPAACLAAGLRFATPAEVVAALPPDPGPPLTIPDAVSWADVERDLSAWLGNPLQDAALADLQALGDRVRALGDRRLRDTWRRLQTSDHFYYMCTKADACGAVHAWFTPFATPHDAWLVYTNVLNDFRLRLATLEARRG